MVCVVETQESLKARRVAVFVFGSFFAITIIDVTNTHTYACEHTHTDTNTRMRGAVQNGDWVKGEDETEMPCF